MGASSDRKNNPQETLQRFKDSLCDQGQASSCTSALLWHLCILRLLVSLVLYTDDRSASVYVLCAVLYTYGESMYAVFSDAERVYVKHAPLSPLLSLSPSFLQRDVPSHSSINQLATI